MFIAARLSQVRVLHPSAKQEKVAKGEVPHYPQVAVIEATESYVVCSFAGWRMKALKQSILD